MMPERSWDDCALRSDCADALFEDVKRDVGLFFVYDQRRAEADRAGTASEEQDSLLERQFHDFVPLRIAVFLGDFVLDDLDAKHQTAAADIADQLQFRWPVRHTLPHVIAEFGGVLQQMFFLDHVESGQRRSDRDGITAKGGGVRAGNPVHDLGASDGDAQRHAGRDALGAADDVGLDAGVLDRPPLAGACDAALYFVNDKQNAVAVADAAEFLHEDRGGDNVSALTLDGLDKDRGDFLGSQRGLEDFLFDEAGAAESEGIRFLLSADASAVDVGIANVGHSWNERREAATLLRLGSRQ